MIKVSDTSDSSYLKNEPRPVFSNKEIIVRHNGNLVQLILTPSSSKIVNGITLEVQHASFMEKIIHFLST